MKKLSIVFAGCILMVFAQTAAAAYWGGVKISTIRSIGQSTVYVGFDVQPTGTCSNWGEEFKFDSSTDNGKALLSGLMVAFASGSTVDIWYIESTNPDTDQSNGCGGNEIAVLQYIRLKA